MRHSAPATAKQAHLDEPRPGSLTIGYMPSEPCPPKENPPRFSWLPDIDDGARYVLRISTDSGFADDKTRTFPDLAWNFFTPDEALPAGRYHWSYALWDQDTATRSSNWSAVRSFEITDALPKTPLPGRAARHAAGHMSHPRLWLDPDQLSAFAAAVAKNPDHCGWSDFFAKSVQPWLERPIIGEPRPYPNNTRVATLWRQMYIDCQEVIYAIRHLAIAGRVLGRDDLLDASCDWLLAVAAWDPSGTTSRAYNDEAAFRIVVALAWGYDWLHDHLSEEQRETVRSVLLRRTREVAEHVIAHARIHVFPYDSHAVRSLSAVLAPACIALCGESDEATEWLDYTVEFLATLYSPWAGTDGGWAEGPHYWMTGMAYLIEAANLIRSYLDFDLYQRPFFQNTGRFPLYTKAPGTRRAGFGDDSTMGDLPGLKVGYNVRQFAGVTGDGHYQWYFDRIRADAAGTEAAFYNYGWWDLNFDDLVYRHDYRDVAATSPADLPALAVFHDIGWAAIQKNMDDPDGHLQFVFKSSPYGSLSHSHGDQNAFVLYAYGEDLAIQSGHYVAFNSSMHLHWRRQTRSKNAVLIGGKGQYAEKDKALARRAGGRIVDVEEKPGHVRLVGDATAAYQVANPLVQRAEREIHFVNDSYFVIVDRVECSEPQELQWLCHTVGAPQTGRSSFRYNGRKAGFYGQFVFSSAGMPQITAIEGFTGIDPAEHEGLDVHHHVCAEVPAAVSHRLVTLLVPYSLKEPKRIFSFIDDQGFSTDIYFTDVDDCRFKLSIPKQF
ncbi:alginate lyase [Nitratireductor sp. ZSWI3]|uniref:alginate lyase n=1 Tax=Nitratireductor sp. ZSWI3 TaxID=2966359 RepID=UPI00214FA59B|nr:alginate lyase [Nitratireductor sp. ZSWI3]MCR4265418.1 alginate lyase [Nitratireductor sp. ZSWI3]